MKPKVLKKGDTVGFVTPSTYVSSPDEIATALRTAEYFGLKVKMGPNVRKRAGYMGRPITERLTASNRSADRAVVANRNASTSRMTHQPSRRVEDRHHGIQSVGRFQPG